MSEKKPRGRPPKNKIWDIKTNSWIQKEKIISELKQNDTLNSNKKIKFISWNVAGLRAIIKKNIYEDINFESYIRLLNPDFLCLTETKITKEEDIEKIDKHLLLEYPYRFWNGCKTKHGYSSTAILTKYKPLQIDYGFNILKEDKKEDKKEYMNLIFNEGRLITLEYEDFYLVNVYTPNSGSHLKRLNERINIWDKYFREYVILLKNKKNVIITGDLNVAHNEIDLKNPKTNTKSAGFTKEERESFNKLLNEGFIDTFRTINPSLIKYSYWDYKSKARLRNVGWRIDYFLVNNNSNLVSKISKSDILDNINGSDHAPIILEIEIENIK